MVKSIRKPMVHDASLPVLEMDSARHSLALIYEMAAEHQHYKDIQRAVLRAEQRLTRVIDLLQKSATK